MVTNSYLAISWAVEHLQLVRSQPAFSGFLQVVLATALRGKGCYHRFGVEETWRVIERRSLPSQCLLELGFRLVSQYKAFAFSVVLNGA